LVLFEENDAFLKNNEDALQKKDEKQMKNEPNGNYSNPDWHNFNFLNHETEIDGENFLVLLCKNKGELTAWTQNNV
jgi:hypothetical protein